MNGSVTLQDFAASVNNYGSNMSNDDFKMDEEYQDEIDDERKLEEQDATSRTQYIITTKIPSTITVR